MESVSTHFCRVLDIIMESKMVTTTHKMHKLNFRKDEDKGFTLIELLVVIAIIALLLSILMPSLRKAKDQARDVLGFSRLKQFSLMYEMHTQDNDDSLPAGWWGGTMWMIDLLPYYGGVDDIRLCPKATKLLSDTSDPYNAGVFTAWGKYGEGSWEGYIPMWAREGMYGSYGANGWAHNPPPEADSLYAYPENSIGVDSGILFWRKKTNVTRPTTVPLLSGCMWDGTTPMMSDAPPGEEGEQTAYQMSSFCLPRHNGKVQMLFMDTSARKVGLKELWSLRWHRQWASWAMDQQWPSWFDKYPD